MDTNDNTNNKCSWRSGMPENTQTFSHLKKNHTKKQNKQNKPKTHPERKPLQLQSNILYTQIISIWKENKKCYNHLRKLEFALFDK